jgi:hypothetical protein
LTPCREVGFCRRFRRCVELSGWLGDVLHLLQRLPRYPSAHGSRKSITDSGT